MSEHAWRLPLSLDPLIAEAKRRARQRHVLLTAVVLALVLAAGGTTLAVHSFGRLGTSGSYAGPFVPGGMVTGGIPRPYSMASLQAVSAASRNDAWIVGSVAWRWDGSAWRSVPLPTKGPDLWSVAALGPNDAWAVGSLDTGSLVQSRALIEHWNGAHWSVVRLPLLHGAMLYSIAAAGPGSVWAVGATFHGNNAGDFVPHATRPVLLHWGGASWRRVSLPWSRRGVVLDKVVATGPSSVWALSSGWNYSYHPSIEHWNGTHWQAVPVPFGPKDPIAGFGATAGNDAWAVGSYAQGGNRAARYSHALAAHWNGHSWRLTHVPNRPGNNSTDLTAVAAVRPDDVWAIGQTQRLNLDHDGFSSTAPVALLEHWDGQSWSVMPGAAPQMSEGSPTLTATPDGAAWALGTCWANNVITRWTNETWVTSPHPRDWRWRSGLPASWHRRPPSCSATPTAG
jgi:hypothetical protein